MRAPRSAWPSSRSASPSRSKRSSSSDPLTASPPGGTRSYRALFAVDGLPQLVAGMILARIAAQMVGLILVLFILERYASATLAGITTFLSLFPGLLVSPIAGTLLDRYGRRRFIIADYLVAAGAFTLVAFLSFADALPVALLLAMVTMASLTFPLSTTGMRTLFPLIVPRPLWERANAIDSNGYAFAGIVAPAAAGALVGALRGDGALLVTAGIFAVAAAVTLLFREPKVPGTAHGPLLREAWAGVLHVARHPTLRSLALGVSVSNVGNGIFFIALPVVVIQRLGGGSEVVGQLFAGMGLTAFVSVFAFGRMGTEGLERRLLVASMLGITAAIALLLFRSDLPAIAVSALLVGVATGPFDIALFTLRQRRTDPAWLGRAFAVSMALNFIGFPVGSALGGALAATSPEAALLTAVGFEALAAVLTFIFLPRG